MEASIEHDQEAGIEHNQETDAEFDPEVVTGPALKIGLRIGQEPRFRIIVKLIPKMNRPFPRTISRNLQIRGSAFRCLKMGDLATESRDPSAKPHIRDLESWLEDQSDEMGTPPGGEN